MSSYLSADWILLRYTDCRGRLLRHWHIHSTRHVVFWTNMAVLCPGIYIQISSDPILHGMVGFHVSSGRLRTQHHRTWPHHSEHVLPGPRDDLLNICNHSLVRRLCRNSQRRLDRPSILRAVFEEHTEETKHRDGYSGAREGDSRKHSITVDRGEVSRLLIVIGTS